MKSHLIFLLAALSAGLCLHSCHSGNSGDFVTLDYSSVKKTNDTIKASDLASSPEFIALDSDTTEAFSTGDFKVSDNYIIRDINFAMNKTPVKVYDRHTGRFICNAGYIGRGPGEYLKSFQTFVDENGGKIWIMDNCDRIKTYDILSGAYLGEVPLAHEVQDEFMSASASFTVDSEAGTITVAAIPYEEDSNPSIVWCQDMQGNIIREIPETGRVRSRNPSNSLIMSYFNTPGEMDVMYHSQGQYPDTLFTVKDGTFSPLFTVNARSLKNGEFMNSIYLPGKVLSILSENKEVAPNVSMAIPKSCVLTDLATGKSEEYVTSFINDFLRCPGTFSFRNGYLIQSFSALEFMEIGRNALDLGLLHGQAADQVASILADLEETDNDILMLARLRQ